MVGQDLRVTYSTPCGLRVTRLQPAIGAEIVGADLRAVTDEIARDINQVLLAHGVIFFRNQPLDYAAHVALARKFGEPLEEKPDAPQPELIAFKSELGAPPI